MIHEDHLNLDHCVLRSSKLFRCWSVIVEQFAVGTEDVADSWTVL